MKSTDVLTNRNVYIFYWPLEKTADSKVTNTGNIATSNA